MQDSALPFGFPLEGLPLAGNIAMLTDPPKYPSAARIAERLTAEITDKVVTDLRQAESSPIAGHVQGLPVAGYAKNVEQWKIDMVNENKLLEEKVLRRVDAHVLERGDDRIDGASVQLARRHVEDAFYRLNRAIMQPKRIAGDLA
jgi:hypothetical protein